MSTSTWDPSTDMLWPGGEGKGWIRWDFELLQSKVDGFARCRGKTFCQRGLSLVGEVPALLCLQGAQAEPSNLLLQNSKFTNARFLAQSKPRYGKQLPKGQIYVSIVFTYSRIIITLSFCNFFLDRCWGKQVSNMRIWGYDGLGVLQNWVQACIVGPLYSRGGAVDQVSFSCVGNYRRGRYSGGELELLRHFCLQGYIAHRTLCGLMATAGAQANCLCKKVNRIIPMSPID